MYNVIKMIDRIDIADAINFEKSDPLKRAIDEVDSESDTENSNQ